MEDDAAGRVRAGRRPGPTSTRAEILDAARAAFGTVGYTDTSVRAVAASAGVDPSTVLHFFGSKDGLFRAVVGTVAPGMSPLVAALQRRAGGAELVRCYLGMWEGENGTAIRAMIRSSIAPDRAVHLMREGMVAHVLAAVPNEDALGVELVFAQLLGLAINRYITGLPALAGADVDTIAERVGPALDAYLAS